MGLPSEKLTVIASDGMIGEPFPYPVGVTAYPPLSEEALDRIGALGEVVGLGVAENGQQHFKVQPHGNAPEKRDQIVEAVQQEYAQQSGGAVEVFPSYRSYLGALLRDVEAMRGVFSTVR